MNEMCCPICEAVTTHPADAKVVKCANCLRSFQLEPKDMNTESQQQYRKKPVVIDAIQHTERTSMEESLKTKQEWTPKYVESLWPMQAERAVFFKRVADAHNAELTAERQRLEWVSSQLKLSNDSCSHYQQENYEQGKQLSEIKTIFVKLRVSICENAHLKNVAPLISVIDDALAKVKEAQPK